MRCLSGIVARRFTGSLLVYRLAAQKVTATLQRREARRRQREGDPRRARRARTSYADHRMVGTHDDGCATLSPSHHPIIPPIHRHLRGGRLGKERATHLGGQFRYIAAGHFDMEQVIGLILFDAQLITSGPLL